MSFYFRCLGILCFSESRAGGPSTSLFTLYHTLRGILSPVVREDTKAGEGREGLRILSHDLIGVERG
jgi:hypothetical protein